MEQHRVELLREADILDADAVRQEGARRSMTPAQESFWMGPRKERVARLRRRATSLRDAANAVTAVYPYLS